MFGLLGSDLAYIHKIFCEHPSIEEAVLFGSRAKGNYKKASDIDIAIKGTQLESVALAVSGRLNGEGPLPYKVDIVDYGNIDSKNLKEHIDRVGVTIYSKP